MRDDTAASLSRFTALWDWRRRIAELYGQIRMAPAPEPAWALWRETRDTLFRRHAQSPLSLQERASFRGLPYPPYDRSLRFLVELEAAADSRTETMTAGVDGQVTLLPFARTRGLAARFGGELTLYWITLYGGGVFLPFRDATSGKTSYAGGRYLLDTIKGADLGMVGERVVLDFNFAYNPSCAYSEQWICPLPPAANTLASPITAGEQLVRR